MSNSLITMCLRAQEARKASVDKSFREKSRNLTALESWYYDCLGNPEQAIKNRDMQAYGYDPETKEVIEVSDIEMADMPLTISQFAKSVGRKVSLKVTAQEIAIRADGMEDTLFNTVVSNDYKAKASSRFLPKLYGKTPAQALALGYTEKELITKALDQKVILKDGVFTDAK